MSKTKETLNGAYNPLPTSPDQTHNTFTPIPTKSRRRKILRFVILITLVLCIASFAFGLAAGLILHTRSIKVYVSEAKIKEFELISNDTVKIKVEMAMVFRNPVKCASVHYKSIYSMSYYEANWFGSVVLPKFHLARQSTKILNPVVFEGKWAMPTGWRSEELYTRKEEGFVDVDVRAHTRIRFKIGFFKTKKHTAEIFCRLNKIPLSGNVIYANTQGFRGTRCYVNL